LLLVLRRILSGITRDAIFPSSSLVIKPQGPDENTALQSFVATASLADGDADGDPDPDYVWVSAITILKHCRKLTLLLDL
jgi:hypothetical protein